MRTLTASTRPKTSKKPVPTLQETHFSLHPDLSKRVPVAKTTRKADQVYRTPFDYTEPDYNPVKKESLMKQIRINSTRAYDPKTASNLGRIVTKIRNDNYALRCAERDTYPDFISKSKTLAPWQKKSFNRIMFETAIK